MNIKDSEIMELFFEVSKLNRRYEQSLMKDKSPYKGQYRCLFILESMDKSPNQKELAEAMGVRPASLSEILDKLEDKGFIKRRRSEEDRRVTIVNLTDEGLEEVERAKKKRAEYHVNMLSPLDSSEKTEFFRLLKKIRKNYMDLEMK